MLLQYVSIAASFLVFIIVAFSSIIDILIAKIKTKQIYKIYKFDFNPFYPKWKYNEKMWHKRIIWMAFAWFSFLFLVIFFIFFFYLIQYLNTKNNFNFSNSDGFFSYLNFESINDNNFYVIISIQIILIFCLSIFLSAKLYFEKNQVYFEKNLLVKRFEELEAEVTQIDQLNKIVILKGPIVFTNLTNVMMNKKALKTRKLSCQENKIFDFVFLLAKFSLKDCFFNYSINKLQIQINEMILEKEQAYDQLKEKVLENLIYLCFSKKEIDITNT